MKNTEKMCEKKILSNHQTQLYIYSSLLVAIELLVGGFHNSIWILYFPVFIDVLILHLFLYNTGHLKVLKFYTEGDRVSERESL